MTVLTGGARERLHDIRERKGRAREQIRKAREGLAAANGDSQMEQAFQLALGQAETDHSIAQELESNLLRQITGISQDHQFGESFLDDPQAVTMLERLAHSKQPVGRLDLGPASSAEQLVAAIESGSWHAQKLGAAGDADVPDTARLGPYYGFVPQLQRQLRLLDLVPTSSMEGKSFDYTREGGSLDTAVETAEGAVKPQADDELTDASVVAKTIAHYIKLKRQQLADVPTLATAINRRLTYGVLRRVENQIIGGDGTGENLLGVLHTTGISSVTFAAGTPLTDLSLDGITDIIVSDAQPNGVVANPLDVATMLKAKASGSGERLDSEGAFGAAPTTLWGLPLIQSRVIPQGQLLVGDWAQGTTLFVREGVNIRLSDSDQDDFIRNKVTMLGEGRWGLAVWQPAAFALVHLA